MSSHASGPGPSLPTAQTPPAVANWNDVLALHLPLDPTVPPSRAFTNVNDSTHGYSARQPAPSSVPLPNTLTHDSDLVPRITTALQTGIQQLSTVPFPTATFEDALAEISETMSGIGRESIVSDTFMLVKSYLQKTLRPIFAQHGYELVLALESPAHLSSQVGDRNLVVNTTPEDASHVIAVEYKTFRAFMKHCYKEELFRTRGSFDCRQPAEGALAMLVKLVLQSCFRAVGDDRPRRFALIYGGYGALVAELDGSTVYTSAAFSTTTPPHQLPNWNSTLLNLPPFSSEPFLAILMALICHRLPRFRIASPTAPLAVLLQAPSSVIRSAGNDEAVGGLGTGATPDAAGDAPVVRDPAGSPGHNILPPSISYATTKFKCRVDVKGGEGPKIGLHFPGEVVAPTASVILDVTLLEHDMATQPSSADFLSIIPYEDTFTKPLIVHTPHSALSLPTSSTSTSSTFPSSRTPFTQPVLLQLARVLGTGATGVVWSIEPSSSSSLSHLPLVIKLFASRDILAFAREHLFYREVFPTLSASTLSLVPSYIGSVFADHGGYYGIILEDVGTNDHGLDDDDDDEEEVKKCFSVLEQVGIMHGDRRTANVLKRRDASLRIIDFERSWIVPPGHQERSSRSFDQVKAPSCAMATRIDEVTPQGSQLVGH